MKILIERLPSGLLGAAMVLLGGLSSVRAVTINFDVDVHGNPITAPIYFFQTTQLTELYGSLGVHFSGPSDGNGGRILNDNGAAPGSLNILAVSGHNFLAFSGLGINNASDPERITFDTPMSLVSIYAAGTGNEGGFFTMQAFGAGGVLLDTHSITTDPGQYGELLVSSSTGIQYVVLDNNNLPFTLGGWVYDNLSATPVPEPTTFSLIIIGIVFKLLLSRLTMRCSDPGMSVVVAIVARGPGR